MTKARGSAGFAGRSVLRRHVIGLATAVQEEVEVVVEVEEEYDEEEEGVSHQASRTRKRLCVKRSSVH